MRLGPASRPVAVWVCLGLLVTLGLRGLAGGAALVADPSGGLVGLSTGDLAGSPFEDYLVPGLVLLTGFGVAPLGVGAALYGRRRRAPGGVLLVGGGLVVWVCVEAVVTGVGERLQWLNLVVGVALVVGGAWPDVRRDAGGE